MDNRATLFAIREIVDAERKAAIEATHTAKGEPETTLAHARWERADVAYDLADRLWKDECEAVNLTLRRSDAKAIADRIRGLHHQPEWTAVDLNDAAEPLAWLLQPLAVALGEYGPGVRRDKSPVAN